MIYSNFSYIEHEVKAKFPPILYKYKNWANDNSKNVLKECSIWFSAPSQLNDKFDVRIGVRFDAEEVNHPIFFEKVKAMIRHDNPHLAPNSRDIEIISENHLDRMKENPIKWFEAVYNDLRNNGTFDVFGVFSLTTDPLNGRMWAHYANTYKGYCIGFDTIELLRKLNMSFGPVEYRTEPYLHSFIEEKWDDLLRYYIKDKGWEYEQEWRVLNIEIPSISQRLIKLDVSIIKEVYLGSDIPIVSEREIIKYNSQVRLYKVKPGVSTLEKVEMQY
jgi:hypothetical protein